MKKVGLVLGSGGARGIAHIAFLKVFDELDITPRVISGTSIGALVGGFYASGYSADEILGILGRMNLFDINKLTDLTLLRPSGFFKGDGIEKFLRTHLDDKNFKELNIPLTVSSTNFWERENMLFREGSVVKAIRASIALPGLIDPLVLDGSVYVDGGLTNPLPVDAVRNECDLIVAINVLGKKTPGDPCQKPVILENLFTSFSIQQESIIRANNKLHKIDLYVQPDLDNIRMLDFFRFEEIIDLVGDDAKKFKNELKKMTGL